MRATAKAALEAGTPAYTAVWMNTSVISSTVRPLRRAARTCMPISFSARIEIRAASVTALRIRRSIPGRDHAPPQA